MEKEWTVYETVLYWHETDPAGIAFWAHYLFWAEKAFVKLLAERGYLIEEKGLPHNIGFPVTSVQCRYLKPIVLRSRLKVLTTISPESNTRRLIIPFKIILSRTEQVAAEGETRRRFVSLESFQPIECPRELKKYFGIS